MNCPKCNTPAAAGASHCKRCGAPLTAKAAAAASASGDIDLMPLEESKTPAFSPYEPPPDLGLPPAPGAKAAPGDPKGPTAPGDYVPKIRGANAAPKQSNLGLIVGGVILALIVGLVLWRVFRTENKVVVGNPKVETFVSLQPNATRVEKIEVSGLVPYTFDVEILDGELLIGVVQRSHSDSTKLADLKKLSDPLESGKKGEKKSLSGEFKHKVQYSWVLANDTKKPARAKIKFVAQPK